MLAEFLRILIFASCALAGCATLTVNEGGSLSFNPLKLLRYSAGIILGFVLPMFCPVMFFRYSNPGIAFVLTSIFFMGAIIASLSVGGLRLRPRCPYCATTASHYLRVIPTYSAAFLGLFSCKNCGGVLTIFQESSRTPRALALSEYCRAFFLCGATTIVLTLSGIYIVGRGLNAAGSVVLEHARDEVKAAGFSYSPPTDVPKVPEPDNAVFWIRQAKQQLRSKHDSNWDRYWERDKFIRASIDGQLAAAKLAEARKIVGGHLDAIKSVEIAATKKGIDWGIDYRGWPHPYESHPADMDHLLGLGDIIAYRAIVDDKGGRMAQAVGDVRLGLWLAWAVDQRGDILGHSYALALYRRALDAASVILPRIDAETAIKSWGPCLMPNDLGAIFRKVLAAELFVPMESGLAAPQSNVSWYGYWYGLAYLKYDVASSHRRRLALLKSIELPYPLIHANYQRIDASSRKGLWLLGALAVYNPNIEGLNAMNVGGVAQMRLALAAIEARRSLEHGKIPNSISEADPFSDQPLKLKLDKNALTIYSVGPDGQDDGGKLFNRSNEKGDIVWRLPTGSLAPTAK